MRSNNSQNKVKSLILAGLLTLFNFGYLVAPANAIWPFSNPPAPSEPVVVIVRCQFVLSKDGSTVLVDFPDKLDYFPVEINRPLLNTTDKLDKVVKLTSMVSALKQVGEVYYLGPASEEIRKMDQDKLNRLKLGKIKDNLYFYHLK